MGIVETTRPRMICILGLLRGSPGSCDDAGAEVVVLAARSAVGIAEAEEVAQSDGVGEVDEMGLDSGCDPGADVPRGEAEQTQTARRKEEAIYAAVVAFAGSEAEMIVVAAVDFVVVVGGLRAQADDADVGDTADVSQRATPEGAMALDEVDKDDAERSKVNAWHHVEPLCRWAERRNLLYKGEEWQGDPEKR